MRGDNGLGSRFATLCSESGNAVIHSNPPSTPSSKFVPLSQPSMSIVAVKAISLNGGEQKFGPVPLRMGQKGLSAFLLASADHCVPFRASFCARASALRMFELLCLAFL